MPIPTPVHQANEEARKLAHDLIAGACFGALAVLRDGAPHVSRVAIALDPDNVPVTLISDLSLHTQALRDNPVASLMVGEPKERGDPLNHPRLTIKVSAELCPKSDQLTQCYLNQHPEAALYIGFGDFHLYRLNPVEGFLNAGFGKAYHMAKDDLT